MKKIFILVLLVIICFSLYFFYFKDSGTVQNITYEYTKIEKGDIKKTVSATGTIVPTSKIILSSEISGKIVNVFKDYNNLVTAGEKLAIFDPNPFVLKVEELQTAVDISNSKLKQKKASLQKANAELSNAQSNRRGSIAKIDDYKLYVENLKQQLSDQEKLFKNKYISKKEFENSKLDFDRSVFQLQNLKAGRRIGATTVLPS